MRKSRGKMSRKTRTGPRGQKLWFNQSGDSVTVWQHYGQEGTSWSLGEGTHLGGTDFTNDDVSSIDVPEGMRAVLHQHHRTNSDFNADDAITIDGPASQDVPSSFNDQLSEIDVESMDMPDSDTNQAPDLNESSLLTYAQEALGYSASDAQKIFNYAQDYIITSENWVNQTQQKADENGRSFGEQAMRESAYMLRQSGSIVKPSDELELSQGLLDTEQRAGFFSGTTGMILIGVAVLGVGYMIYKRNRQN